MTLISQLTFTIIGSEKIIINNEIYNVCRVLEKRCIKLLLSNITNVAMKDNAKPNWNA